MDLQLGSCLNCVGGLGQVTRCSGAGWRLGFAWQGDAEQADELRELVFGGGLCPVVALANDEV